MNEIKKQLNANLSFKKKLKLFFVENFNKNIAIRRVQKFGGWLSAMIMPMIGVIIAWGLLTAFFLKDGWTPVQAINDYVIQNMITYLLPTLIAFNAGKLVHDTRGGVIATVVVFGVIVGNQFNPGFIEGQTATPQFLAAMVVGPMAAGVLKGFDKLVDGKIKQGFEMLVNNFSLGILGALMTVGAFYGMPYVFNSISWVLMKIVNFLISNSLIFLAAIVIEPAKVLFINNAINHGVLTPIGLEMAKESGKSILFLLESNPGPGLGILIATILFDRKARGNAMGASVIHFFGGIHEVYFPFILMRFQLLLALLAGGLVGDAVFQIFNVGLRAPASPGSIIAIYIQSYSSAANYAWLSVGVVLATTASFLVAALIFFFNRKRYKKQDTNDLQKATEKTIQLKGKNSELLTQNIEPTITQGLPELIIFACDAGMGSSAMGASLLRKKIKDAELGINVKNYPIKELPSSAEFVITQKALTELAKKKVPTAEHRSINNFLDKEFYDNLIKELQEQKNFLTQKKEKGE